MTSSSSRLADHLNDRADAHNPGEIRPGLFLNMFIAGATIAIRQLPGMAAFNPMLVSVMIGIAFHNIAGTVAWAQHGVTFSLRWLLRIAAGVYQWLQPRSSRSGEEVPSLWQQCAPASPLPALPGGLAFLFIAAIVPLIKLME
jgi:hypothetical protein